MIEGVGASTIVAEKVVKTANEIKRKEMDKLPEEIDELDLLEGVFKVGEVVTTANIGDVFADSIDFADFKNSSKDVRGAEEFASSGIKELPDELDESDFCQQYEREDKNKASNFREKKTMDGSETDGSENRENKKSEEQEERTESYDSFNIKDSETDNQIVNDSEQKKDLPIRMEPQTVIKFKCPDGMDKKEFLRQLKGQERGLNSQSVYENMKNRADYQRRKEENENGNGRAKEGAEAQKLAREKAFQSRIASNIKNGMSYSEAKKEAKVWLDGKAALHNPDQIAGGDPIKVSRMGDKSVNSSIGRQWRDRVAQLDRATKEFAKDYTDEELDKIKMNVKLEVE